LLKRVLLILMICLGLALTLTSSTASARHTDRWTKYGWGSLAKFPHKPKPTHTTTATPTPTTPAPTTTAPPPPPSGPIPGPEAGFSRVFTDEFGGTALDTTKWSPYSGVNGSSSGCSEVDNNTVANGVLTMLFAYQPSGVCGARWYHGSMMVKSQYGGNNQSVTLRFRVIASDPANTRSHHILPMRWPNDDKTWFNGESDYCEGSSYSMCTMYLHYRDDTSQIARDIFFDQTQWHTIRATQKAGNDVEIFVDDMSTPVVFYDGSTTTVPDVLKRTVLQQECRSSCPTDTTDWEKIEVDWLTIDNQ
jgi:hypothetical protein